MEEIDWTALVKGAISLVASFGTGYATAILQDVTFDKAVAGGIVAAGAYILGNQQQTVAWKKSDAPEVKK